MDCHYGPQSMSNVEEIYSDLLRMISCSQRDHVTQAFKVVRNHDLRARADWVQIWKGCNHEFAIVLAIHLLSCQIITEFLR